MLYLYIDTYIILQQILHIILFILDIHLVFNYYYTYLQLLSISNAVRQVR